MARRVLAGRASTSCRVSPTTQGCGRRLKARQLNDRWNGDPRGPRSLCGRRDAIRSSGARPVAAATPTHGQPPGV